MGYGSRALALLQDYFLQKIQCLDEEVPAESISPVPDDDLGLLEEQIGNFSTHD